MFPEEVIKISEQQHLRNRKCYISNLMSCRKNRNTEKRILVLIFMKRYTRNIYNLHGYKLIASRNIRFTTSSFFFPYHKMIFEMLSIFSSFSLLFITPFFSRDLCIIILILFLSFFTSSSFNNISTDIHIIWAFPPHKSI